MLVGTYVYHCADPTAPHAPDRLTLRADGTYVLVHVSGGRAGKTDTGTWHLFNNPPSPKYGNQPVVAVGRNGYPVEIKGKRARLLIDLDLGHWYEKTS